MSVYPRVIPGLVRACVVYDVRLLWPLLPSHFHHLTKLSASAQAEADLRHLNWAPLSPTQLRHTITPSQPR